jgi:Trypsin-like peptidase domain
MKPLARSLLLLFAIAQAGLLPAQSTHAIIPRAEVQFKVTRAVVELIALGPGEHGKNRECQATGFLVNEDGYLLTSAHVVDEARDCLAGAPPERILAKPLTADPSAAGAVPCQLVGLDELHDLALLKTLRPLFQDRPEATNGVTLQAKGIFLRLDVAPLEDGTAVGVAGHPNFAWHAETKSGRFVGRGSAALLDGNSQKSEVLYLDIPLLKGSSGSPVYRMSDGSVVGIIERKDLRHPGRTITVPIRYAVELLDRIGVKWYPSQKQGPQN